MTNTTNPTNRYTVPSVSIATAHTGASSKPNELGMRTMQERAYTKRGEQYLLIKSPPASGKSRALMFIALDKLHNQGLQQAIVVVPERSIGSSFADEPLSQHGFYWDWQVLPQWNLCNAPGIEEPRVAKSKVDAVRAFLDSSDKTLVCTHATFRFAVEELGIEAFDNRLIAIDEFHHVSANPDNKLGSQLSAFINRDKMHLVAMTGSYFRGDSEAVLAPTEEAKFETVTYTYYEQLNGYRWLKSLDIGYFFYTGKYVDAVAKVLDPALKTIIHIPNVNARESLKDKEREVNEIMNALGDWQGVDPATGFHLIKAKDGRTLKVADLVDDSDASRRSKVLSALKDPAQKNNRDNVDVIIALGMAKEGFDWIWCEHALTIGYRSSLTEIVQIIGRATRDAEGKERSRFTNLIAEPMADQAAVAEAVNDMLKAISASLLMEQVLAPRYEFSPKDTGPKDGFTYNGGEGYQSGGTNLGVNEATGQYHVEINGLTTPQSTEASRICKEDLNEVVTSFLQDKTVLERGLFDKENTLPEELTQLRMGKIVRERYPDLSDVDQEAIRQHAIAAMNITQQAKLMLAHTNDSESGALQGSTSLLEGVRKFVNVRELDIDLIDRINPFEAAYAVLAKAMDEKSLRQVQASIAAKKVSIPENEARDLAVRALQFKNERGRLPDINSADVWEKRMAEGVVAFARYRAQAKAAQEESTNG
ncbi:DEAD/DEAH box helicase [Pseudomonas syringae pv. theae]|uniref:DEAD/DEAH box helicase n=2 Tax=Pseudomonas syringae group TaxID=136849 RepID=A0A9P3AFC6_PSEA0|nr:MULTISPECIES: DEAD/DEAH box helicase [Pseudomonas syringae group]MBL3828941.1 DEAD/DEAH box helicase [Pseudomonas syringae pv. theae]MBL3833226.1 DEAD/DEAH box helicase [Pseudomonas syringae pv. theae]MBL3868830.1 DEAD/DEAH box helicase [Pseudomonas syringae pv. theae]MBL3875787.1 DEAD/DEAH box helicase [Pseudomonas syringae pv. theae]GFZ61573.1 DEAD/DEAH box helicase [Pseudomonas amygdali pv. eriobotryae]